jgi:rubrerythrin
VDRALCVYGEKLALRPGEMKEDDVRALRAAGLDDRAIHDADQVVAYFSYINRVADGLGVDLEPDMEPKEPSPDLSISVIETGTMTIIWRCLRCNHHLPAGEALPEKCPSCGAPRTELALVEED